MLVAFWDELCHRKVLSAGRNPGPADAGVDQSTEPFRHSPLRVAWSGFPPAVLLTLAQAIEIAEWNIITDLSATLRLSVEDVLKTHREAIEWAAASLR